MSRDAVRSRQAEEVRRQPLSISQLHRTLGADHRRSTWETTADLKSTFASADFVSDKVVFNIGGNKYRLTAVVSYVDQILSIQDILTHEDYDKDKWK